jgi:hypothetical protein
MATRESRGSTPRLKAAIREPNLIIRSHALLRGRPDSATYSVARLHDSPQRPRRCTQTTIARPSGWLMVVLVTTYTPGGFQVKTGPPTVAVAEHG